ncbi:MAG: Zn-dependent hydrolase [Acidobacteriia bacterium]|nr:Zn-dependent hydrolase [Terriglobia bacterium]
MTRKPAVLPLAIFVSLAFAAPTSVSDRLAMWKPVEMPLRSAGLSDRERQMVDKLVAACRLLDDVYWRQSDAAGLALLKSTSDPALKRLLTIMGSRGDLLDENRPFAGSGPLPPGHELYPHDLTRAAIEQYVAQHPADKAAIYDPFTVVKRQGARLTGVPYHEEYKAFLQPMAQALRDAAALSDEPAFAAFLRLRADALLSDDYYPSDLAWLDLKDPKFDIIFAPYETYLDDLLGVKTSYGASILIRNEAESRKLAVYQKYVPDIQDALPIDPAGRPSKRGHLTPMEVMDAPYRAGDLLHGYQAVADNLPNDPRIHQEKGSKKIFFKNFMDARVNYVILPIARQLMPAAQAARASGEGYLAGTLLHEIAHELGPAFAHRGDKQFDIREAIGPAYSGLEEAKADAAGMFGLKWLVDHGALPKDRLEEYYASYVAGLFRTLRFGTGEAHGRAEMMEFNYLLENHALSHAGGRYTIDYARMPAIVAQLAHELLAMEATGDRTRAENWFARYDKMPAELTAALAAVKDIPVDIEPVFSFKNEVR